MPSVQSLRVWTWLHKWSSLVCTAFMLLLCLTGLPLIFHHEIDHLLGAEIEAPEMPDDTPRVSLDRILQVAQSRHPDRVVQYASQPDDHDKLWSVTLTPTLAATEDYKSVLVDARTGEVLAQPRYNEGFMYIMLKLHEDLFAGLPGRLFLGFMGLLLLVATISGVVLYAPFMRKLRFGEVRRARSPRTKWLDLHNLIGITTLVWVLVVSATGSINSLSDLLAEHWQNEQVGALIAPYKGKPVMPAAARDSMQRSLEAALAHTPNMRVAFIAFPGTAFSSPYHNTFFLRGATPLTSRLLQPVLVDAHSATVTAAPDRPWYLTMLQVSQPLHFGDYGGLPMKILWGLLDVASIVLLASGLYLWLKRRPSGALESASHPRRTANHANRP